jgi:hypothetical protein
VFSAIDLLEEGVAKPSQSLEAVFVLNFVWLSYFIEEAA